MKALRESEERYRLLFENGPLGVVTCDRSGNVTAINRKMLDILGAQSGDFAMSTNLLSFPLLVSTGISGDIAMCLSRGESVANERHYTSHWNKSGYLRYNMAPFRDGAGDVSGMLAVVEDITWRREAEEGLKASETFLNNVFDSIQDGISVLDRDLNIVRTNHVMEEWYRHMTPLKGKKCYQVFHGRSVPCDICPSLRAIWQKAMQSDIVPFHDESGDIRGWQEIFAFPLIDDKGNVTGVIEHVRDITERKRAEEALQESEEKYRFLVENSKDIIWMVDLQGKWKFISGNVEKVSGYRTDEILSKTVWDLLAPEYIDLARDKLQRRLRGEDIPPYEVMLVSKDGRHMPFELHPTPIFGRDGKIMGVQGVSRDITYRRQAEEALRSSEARFRALFENAGTAIVVVDDETGIVLDCNSNAEKMFGRPRGEITGMSVMQLHPPDDSEMHHSNIVRQAERGHIVNYEAEALHKDGRRIPVIINATPVTIDGRKIMMGFFLDISWRKQAEDSLRESEEKFRALTETVTAAICILQDGKFQYVNSAMETISGYTKEELMSINPMDIVHPDMKEYLKGTYARWQKCPDIEFRYEFKGISKPGDVKWVDVSRKTIDYNGRPALLLTGIDITGRKRTEEALRNSEERYRQLTESSADFIYVIGRNFRVQYVNRSGATSLRLSQEDAIGKGIESLFPLDTHEHMKKSLSQVFDTGKPYSSEMVHRFYSGDFYIHVVLTPLFDSDGSVGSVMGVSRDINDLKKAESALRESEEKFRVLAETSPTAICVFRGERFFYVNPAVERISGYAKEDFLKMRIWDLLIPACRDPLKERAENRKRGGAVPSHYELGFYHKDGQVRWVDITLGPVNIGGAPAFIVSAYDVTERRRVEKELLEAKSQSELYLDLMGHDINNMHQMALGYLEIARDAGADDGQRALLDKPIEVLQRSARLIRNVRKLQRLREGMINAQTIDLCTLLSDLGREYESLPGKPVSVNLNGHTCCYVRADELLYDVFSNLTGNAIKHTDGHADIRIGLDRRMEEGRLWYRVSVEDSGPGITDDFKDMIFKRLLKGTTKAKGSGIGLYLVKSLVDSYGGRVWVEDTVPGDHTRGAKFVVMLPATELRPEK